MADFTPREKLGKKQRKALDARRRAVWTFSPATKKIDSKKLYNRKKLAHASKNSFDMSGFYILSTNRVSALH